jgi:hypothetical protein
MIDRRALLSHSLGAACRRRPSRRRPRGTRRPASPSPLSMQISSSAPSAGSGKPRDATTGWSPIAIPAHLLQHRRGRLRADRLSDRRRARLDHPRRGTRPDAHHAALLLGSAAGTRAERQDRAQGLLLPFHRHDHRRTLPRRRALQRRHHAPVHGHSLRRTILRPRRSGRKPRSAASPTRSTPAPTGTSSDPTGASRSRWAGIPERG